VDLEEIFDLAQLSTWPWLKHKMSNVNFF